jgi:arylsulfatase A-like enzyme
MIIGIMLGLLDGLNAVDSTGGPNGFRSVLALMLSMGIWGAIWAVGLPVLLRFLRRPPAAAPEESDRLFPVTQLLALAAICVWLGLAGSLVSGWIQDHLDVHRDTFRVGLAFVVSLLIGLILGRIFGHRLFRTTLRVPLLVLTAVLPIGIWVLEPRSEFAAQIDIPQPHARSASVKPLGGPNVLLIVLDTTRAQNLSAYGYARETTPFLREFAGEGTLYLDAISPAPWTVPAHASLFTGLMPSIHQATTEHRWLSSRFHTVAEILRDNGYLTAGFSCNSWVGPSFNLHQGFQHFFQVYRFPHVLEGDPVARLAWGRAATRLLGPFPPDKGAATTNRLVRRWLDGWQKAATGRPFFVFINYIEPHLPYDPPPGPRSHFANAPPRPALRGLLGDEWFPALFRAIGFHDLGSEDYQQLASLYDAEVAYLDSELRELLGGFRRRGLLDNTLVVIVGDHGENLGEHEGLLDHCFSLHQTLLHVPLIVRYPPLFPRGERYPGLVSTASVFSTIVEAAGAKVPPDSPAGASPLPRSGREPGLAYAMSEYELPIFELSSLATEAPGTDVRPFAVRQRSIQDGRFKLIWRSDSSSALYDLASDPGEENPLVPSGTSDGERLSRQLSAWVAGLRPENLPPPASEASLDPRTRESLRSLGYVQ